MESRIRILLCSKFFNLKYFRPNVSKTGTIEGCCERLVYRWKAASIRLQLDQSFQGFVRLVARWPCLLAVLKFMIVFVHLVKEFAMTIS